ncbi:D-alanine--D-alanine ligase [Ascidiimonas sp. W6]|uniref:D-alanine--D-alanine ligase n=1 Tax=Ascidiimonas meishanensis TaxID=3128903 RepID=UPI0030EB2CCE
MKKQIAIIMGGYSSEYLISIRSGETVYKHLNRSHFDAYRIQILKNKWVYIDNEDKEYPVNRSDFSIHVDGHKITFDCVFNAIHGTPGEDGQIQAYLSLLGIPQTSNDFYQSALTFNKRDTLAVLKPYGIKCATSYYVDKGDAIDTKAIVNKVGLPCFVKANRSGSSFGVTKVYKEIQLEDAIEKAFKEGDEIIIEAFLDGREVSVGVIRYQGKVKVLPVTEITTTNDFFDYQAKYEGKSEEITPAVLPKGWTEKVSFQAKKVYEVLHLKGFSRSEYIFVNEEPYLLEVNTIPGLTDASLLPEQASAAGISLSELFGSAINEAINDASKKLD